MNTMMRGVLRLALGAAVLTGAGCAQMGQLGTLGDVLGGVMNPQGAGAQGQISGRVENVDTRNARLEIYTQEGRREAVFFDDRTRVIYQQREYPVTALERGDEVALRVQRDNRGNLYTGEIHVQRNVREGGGGYGNEGQSGSQVQRLEGNVGYVDTSRGQFEVRSQYGGTVLVTLPYGASASTVDRFRRLRNGDYVRMEVIPVNQQRAELQRFL